MRNAAVACLLLLSLSSLAVARTDTHNYAELAISGCDPFMIEVSVDPALLGFGETWTCLIANCGKWLVVCTKDRGGQIMLRDNEIAPVSAHGMTCEIDSSGLCTLQSPASFAGSSL